MGYDLHITRKEDWSDESPESDISLDEWLEYISSDPELQLSDGYLIDDPENPGGTKPVPGFCEWIVYPGEHKPWFDYYQGSISTKNPDDEIIAKMLSIAEKLNAVVQGDDGEIYELSDDNKITSRQIPDDNEQYTPPVPAKKPWWKFW